MVYKLGMAVWVPQDIVKNTADEGCKQLRNSWLPNLEATGFVQVAILYPQVTVVVSLLVMTIIGWLRDITIYGSPQHSEKQIQQGFPSREINDFLTDVTEPRR